ncbi:MAG: hypothetical protein ACOYMB_03765 [Patescibacteria group bacterium]
MNKKLFIVSCCLAVLGLAILAIMLDRKFRNESEKAMELKISQLTMEKDSIKTFYANLVVPCLPDTVFKKYSNIPESVKTAWLEYSVIEHFAIENYEKIEKAATLILDQGVEKAEAVQKTKNDNADDIYNNKEKKLLFDYFLSDPKLATISIKQFENTVAYSYIYLSSNQNYWSAKLSIDFQIGTSDVNQEKMPEKFKKILATCALEKKISSDMIYLANCVCEFEKKRLQTQYEKKLEAASIIKENCLKEAYSDFLRKVK